MKHVYPTSRRPIPNEMRCTHVTRTGPRAGQRCGQVAFGWQFGFGTCRKHGGDGPHYHEAVWKAFEEWQHGLHAYESPQYRRWLECSFLAAEERWQARAEKRRQRRSDQFVQSPPAPARERVTGRERVRRKLLRDFPYLADEPDALETYVDQRIEQERTQRKAPR